MLNNKGNVAIMMGELATQAAVLRTEGVEKVIAQHPDMKIVQKQTANWRRNEAIDLDEQLVGCRNEDRCRRRK